MEYCFASSNELRGALPLQSNTPSLFLSQTRPLFFHPEGLHSEHCRNIVSLFSDEASHRPAASAWPKNRRLQIDDTS